MDKCPIVGCVGFVLFFSLARGSVVEGRGCLCPSTVAFGSNKDTSGAIPSLASNGRLCMIWWQWRCGMVVG